MPRSSLPPHLNDDSEIASNFQDDAEFGLLWKRFKKFIKPWLAYGPRATEWWARWRNYPVTLIAIKSKSGWFRFETDDENEFHTGGRILLYTKSSSSYLSRVQYYSKWCIQLQWPLFFSCHWYNDEFDVMVPNAPKKDTDGKLINFYIGAKRDADRVYWFPALYAGFNFK